MYKLLLSTLFFVFPITAIAVSPSSGVVWGEFMTPSDFSVSANGVVVIPAGEADECTDSYVDGYGGSNISSASGITASGIVAFSTITDLEDPNPQGSTVLCLGWFNGGWQGDTATFTYVSSGGEEPTGTTSQLTADGASTSYFQAFVLFYLSMWFIVWFFRGKAI